MARHIRTADHRPRLGPAGRLGLALAGLGVAAAVAVPLADRTSAAFGDSARLNTSTSGIGSSDPFDIGLVQDGVFRQATGDGVAWELDADGLVPGTTVETVVPVTNNSPYPADVVVHVEDAYDESRDGGTDPFALYRWTVADAETGEILAGSADPMDSPLAGDDVAGAVAPFPLAARGADPVADGGAWTVGADGSVRPLRITIAYPDTPGSEDYNGGVSRMRLVVAAVTS